eukprot:CAMPEP_0170239296 /NCGR_PEP_ID=MMETSP0116_2-20130129/19405_1 /TAXON_ID=400756 /ORGANISM="Durinskia baltica, Strain CSIRO CS-38" /LENGTH=437 /DNA_ID=CAMNT_0010490113 /DNA_START=60 /DNA_END=1369 /DNA_ORIENTATION=+
MAPTKFYLPGLPEHVTDEEIAVAFAKYGNVTEAAVGRDKATGMPRGHGYVSLPEGSNVDAVLADVHYLGGIGVRALLTKESLAGTEGMKVHLSNCEHVSVDEMREAFSQFGQVIDVHTPKDAMTGERKRFAFVTFSSMDAFNRACEMGSLQLSGQTVDIKPAASASGGKGGKGGKGDPWGGKCGGGGSWGASWGCAGGKGGWGGCSGGKKGSSGAGEGMKYFVSKVPEGCTDDMLKSYFSQYGTVVDARIAMDASGQASKGFGYFTMADESSRDQILTDTHIVGGGQMTVMLSKENLEGTEGKKVHIDNVQFIPVEAIRDAFAQFGPVLDVHTPKDPTTGERRKFAFVTFGTDEAFSAAINQGGIYVGSEAVPIKPAARSTDGQGGNKGSWCCGGGGKGKASWDWGCGGGGKGGDTWGGKGDSWGGKGDSWGGKGAS